MLPRLAELPDLVMECRVGGLDMFERSCPLYAGMFFGFSTLYAVEHSALVRPVLHPLDEREARDSRIHLNRLERDPIGRAVAHYNINCELVAPEVAARFTFEWLAAQRDAYVARFDAPLW